MLKRILVAMLALLMLITGGCTQKPVQAQSFALDTIITIKILSGGDDEDIQAALRHIDQCESLLSAHRSGSDLETINTSEGAAVSIDPLTVHILSSALQIAQQTNNALDITLYEVSRLWDYKSDNPQLPTSEQIQTALSFRGMDRICIHDNTVTVQNTRIDLGAVAKGAIGDEAAQVLKARGVTCALLNLGGNIMTLGDKSDGSPWIVSIEDPDGNGTIGSLQFSGSKAVATSSGAQRYFELDGVRYHHILDPQTGYPADSGLSSVTVLAPDGLTADALSTALFVAGEDAAQTILQQYYPDCAAVLLRCDGTVRVLGDALFIRE